MSTKLMTAKAIRDREYQANRRAERKAAKLAGATFTGQGALAGKGVDPTPEPVDPPEPPDMEATPDQCHDCEAYNTTGAKWATVTVDLDPGNPEVGPDPDICEVSVCPACCATRTAKRVEAEAKAEASLVAVGTFPEPGSKAMASMDCLDAAVAKAQATAPREKHTDKAHVADALNSRLWSRLLTLCRRAGYTGKWQVTPMVAFAKEHGLEAEVPPSRRNGAQVAFAKERGLL